MKSIKTYLLLLFLLVIFDVEAFSQINSEKETYNGVYKFSKTDSMLVESYLTESDYNDKHGVKAVSVSEGRVPNNFYSDEIYNETPSQSSNSKNRFLDAGAINFIVDVAIHTVFLMTVFWQ
tara:strand:- start:840 stop:1202 length:363 start_codon:yes stop_codon:yes gene_type:complete